MLTRTVEGRSVGRVEASMTRSQAQPWHRWLLLGATAVLAVTLSLGWWAVVFTADRRGWTNDGTLILAAAATVATASGVAGVTASSRGRHGLAGLGLLVAAVAAPTVFAYPVNVVLLILAVIELVVARRRPVGGATVR
jgi:hypothetical protein